MDRFLLTMLVVATIAVVFLLMAWGWRNGLKRSAHIAMPSEVVDAPITAGPWEGRFLGTTYAGRWLDRVHAHDLGVRSMVTITVTSQGVNVVRPGARPGRHQHVPAVAAGVAVHPRVAPVLAGPALAEHLVPARVGAQDGVGGVAGPGDPVR